jgi:ribonuclease R
LIVHRALKWALENPEAAPPPGWHAAGDAQAGRRPRDEERVATLGPYRRAELEEISSESSEAERGAEAAERELMDWKTAQFMESHLGEEYDALIISVQKFGFFVELTEIFVEGLVSIDRLEADLGQRCTYRDHDRAIVTEPHRSARAGSGRGATRRVFKMGDRIRVRAERIDPMRHRVEFAPVL